MILYKYRRDLETTEKIFTTKKVWLSTSEDLNDPFECEISSVNTELRLAQILQMKHAQLTGFLVSANQSIKEGKLFFGMSKKQVKVLLTEFKKIKNIDRAYEKFNDFFLQKLGSPPSNPEKMFSSVHEQLSAVGIFSLSAVPDNQLMWSHYAEDHKGVCLGFEITDDSKLADAERFLRVEYSNTVPQFSDRMKPELQVSLDETGRLITESRIAFSDVSLRAAFSTKAPEWKYEREWRYVEPIAGAYDWPAPIVEIIFGLKCSEARREHYLKLAKEFIPNDVRFYEIRKVANSKSIERVRILQDSFGYRGALASSSIEEVHRLMARREYISALPMIDHLLNITIASAELWRCKGIAHGWSENHAEALICFDKAISLDCNFFSAWYQKGVSLTMLGQYGEAINAFLCAQKLCASEPSVAFNLGSILVEVNRLEEAKIQLQIAAKLGHPRASETLKAINAHRSSD